MVPFHLKAILYDAKNDLIYRDIAPLICERIKHQLVIKP